MKLIIKLTTAECIECETAFGVSALLSNNLANRFKNTQYVSPLAQVLPSPYNIKHSWLNWFKPSMYQWFRLKNNTKFEWVAGLFGINVSAIIYEALDTMFGFDEGQIVRGIGINKIVLKTGEVITDNSQISELCEGADESVAQTIEYGECEIDLGNMV